MSIKIALAGNPNSGKTTLSRIIRSISRTRFITSSKNRKRKFLY